MNQRNNPISLSNKATRECVPLLDQLLAQYHPQNFGIRFWDATTWPTAPEVASQFMLTLRNSSVLRNLLWQSGEFAPAEAFISGDLELEGNLYQALPLAEYLSRHLYRGHARCEWT